MTADHRDIRTQAAKGESSVTAISHIERGYADFVPTLCHLGADICLTEV